MNIIEFLIRWKIISRNHKRLGKIYFWSFFLAPLFFILGIIFAYLGNNSSPNQHIFLLAFYVCIGLGVFFVILIILIEIYVFLSWLKHLL